MCAFSNMGEVKVISISVGHYFLLLGIFLKDLARQSPVLVQKSVFLQV